MSRTEAELMKVVDELAMEYLKGELEAVTTDDKGRERQDWKRRRAAATEIHRRAGTLPVMRAMSRGGALHLPPPWPLTDIVEIGGGTGFVDCIVRTLHPQKGKVQQGVRIALGPTGKPTQEQIGEAYHRGSWLLKKQLG